jgi:hypothetical protein
VDRYYEELIIGICCFISSAGSMIIYFGSRSYLLLLGGEMNGKFQIVVNGKSASQNRIKTSDYHTRQSISMESPVSVLTPSTALECEAQIRALKRKLHGILARETYSLDEQIEQTPVRSRPVHPPHPLLGTFSPKSGGNSSGANGNIDSVVNGKYDLEKSENSYIDPDSGCRKSLSHTHTHAHIHTLSVLHHNAESNKVYPTLTPIETPASVSSPCSVPVIDHPAGTGINTPVTYDI